MVDGPVQTRTVVAANREAKAAGLRVGQRLSAAQALLAQFTALPYDPAEVERWQTFLAGVAYRYSSEAALLPHALVLEVSRSRGLFGDWPAIERRLRADLTDLGFRHRLAAAPTPHGAYVLAGIRDGLAVASPDHLRRALEPVPLGKARLPVEAERLPGMGIRTLGQLLRMPRDGLRRRFGAALLDTVDQLLGDRPAGLDLFVPPDTVDWRIELSHEVENVAALIFPVRRMTADLAAYLACRDGGVQRFVLHLEHREGATEVTIGLLAPERAATTLFEAARGRLEQVRLPAPVLALRLRADQLPSFVPEGRDLFDERPPTLCHSGNCASAFVRGWATRPSTSWRPRSTPDRNGRNAWARGTKARPRCCRGRPGCWIGPFHCVAPIPRCLPVPSAWRRVGGTATWCVGTTTWWTPPRANGLGLSSRRTKRKVGCSTAGSRERIRSFRIC